MLKFLLGLIERLNTSADLSWNEIDLLQHPALRVMSERELADLPFSAVTNANAGQSECPA
jgi:hypothetical protein